MSNPIGFIVGFLITHSIFLNYHIWIIENKLDSIATLMEKTEIPVEKANQIKKTN